MLKLFYFTTAINNDTFENIVKNSRVKASIAPQTFERALIKGMCKIDDLALNINSFPMISMFPNSKKIFWGRKKEEIVSNIQTKWISAINLPILKQISIELSSYFILKKWLKENKNEKNKGILIYSIYAPIAKNIIKLSKKYNTKCFAIVADLPRDMYNNARINPIKKYFAVKNVKTAIKIQMEFDGYIYLTEAMKSEINSSAPYIIAEGICDTTIFSKLNSLEKSPKKAIMYAGALNEKFGIKILIEAFLKLQGEYELWLFGSGDYASEVSNYTKIDARIKYFGRVSRDEVLKKEMQASLLVNVRSTKEEFTKYSFPSKTMEYMASGTPLLTSKLEGIPSEYFDFVYTLENVSADALYDKFIEIFSMPDFDLIGDKAREFINSNKNCYVQANKIVDFIRKGV